MRCAFCGSSESNVKSTNVLAATNGLIKVPTCPVDSEYAKETFSNPLTDTQLIRMQKAVIS